MIKPEYGKPVDQQTYDTTLRFFDALLKMLHPFMPFITEELWQHLYQRKEGESIMLSTLTLDAPTQSGAMLCQDIETVKQVVGGVRMVRNQKNIAPKEPLILQAVGENTIKAYQSVITKMASLRSMEVVSEKTTDASSFMVGTCEYAVPVGDLIDVEAELQKQTKELAHLEGFLAGIKKKLSNESFVAHAPEAVVERERKKQADSEEKIAALRLSIAELQKK